MNINIEFLMGAAAAVSAKRTEKQDVLWAVTTFRTDVYVFLKHAGLSVQNGAYPGVESVKADVYNILKDYIDILATFPEEIRYSNEQVEQPRLGSVSRAFDVYNGLKSDSNSWESAQELTRIIATNADSEQAKLPYDVLMGIVLYIMSLLQDIEPMTIYSEFLN